MNEFYGLNQTTNYITPPKYINLVREVLGEIDLDPASTLIANTIVGAKTFYTEREDGLNQPWFGRVFMNHPWGKGEKACKEGCSKRVCWDRGYHLETTTPSNQDWVQKLEAHYVIGSVEEAICLVAASTSEKWFQPLYSYPICFTDHRIAFFYHQ
jgi:hypothetical protein